MTTPLLFFSALVSSCCKLIASNSSENDSEIGGGGRDDSAAGSECRYIAGSNEGGSMEVVVGEVIERELAGMIAYL